MAAFAALASPVHASPVQASDYYAGKTITFLVGTDTGGGFSLYARAIASTLRATSPAIDDRDRNMPGAGGAVASTTTIISPPKTARPLDQWRQRDPRQAARQCVALARESERAGCSGIMALPAYVYYSDWRETRAHYSAIIGATSVGSPTREYASIIKRATGARFEIVSGYKGPADLFVAMERGEIDGVCGIDWSALKAQQPDWLREGKLNLLVQGALPPHPELASLGVPTPWAYIKDDIDRKAVELMVEFQQAFGRTYMAPPGVPAEALHVLRSAFMAVLRDPDFLVDAKNLRIDVTPQAGEHIQRIVEAVHAAPRQVVERLKQIVEP